MTKLKSFISGYFGYVFKGGPKFWLWMASLSVLTLIWWYGYYQQLTTGMIVTGLTDEVSWGLYLGNFIFLVGVAAGAVTVVFPAYVYKHEAMHEITALGEMVAIFAVILADLFVMTHIGRIDRAWHIIPYIGIMNFPSAMLTWDVMVLLIYMALNAVTGFYLLYKRFGNLPPKPGFYKPLVYIAIVWAISIHTITAFLISTFDTRAFWHTSLMPIRFIVGAFVAGPSLIVVIFLQVRKHTPLQIKDEAINLLTQVIVWCLGIALFFSMSEVVTDFYQSAEHSYGLRYLMFGMHGLTEMVPWYWTSIALQIVSFVLLLIPKVRKNYQILPFILVAAFMGIWVEKGLGLLIPGEIPTPIGEFTQYSPTLMEIGISVGIWAFGFMILTILIKGATGILTGEVRYEN